MATGVLLAGINISGAQYNFIRSGVLQGLSSRRLTDALRVLGEPMRRTNLLAVMREVGERQRVSSGIASVRRDRTPDVNRLPPAVGKTRKPYTWVVRLDGQNLDTGEPAVKWVSVGTSNAGLKRQDIEEIALDDALGYAQERVFEAHSASLTGGFRAGAAGLF